MKIGVDLGGSKIEVVVLGDDGQILLRKREATPQGQYAATLETINRLVTRAGEEIPQTADIAVGIATPGALSKVTGYVKNSNSVCLNGKPLQQDLETLLRRPVRLANDADCLALSEAIDGAARNAATVFAAILGTGVGGGIVVNNKLLSGPNAIAGEWGHNPLPWPQSTERPGPACYCGKHGCIETFLSGPALQRVYARESGEEKLVQEIVQLGQSGNELASYVLNIYFDQLARGLAQIINILDPDCIVLGGGLSNIEEIYTQLPDRLPQYVFSDSLQTRIVPAQYGDSSGVRGAAWLWNEG